MIRLTAYSVSIAGTVSVDGMSAQNSGDGGGAGGSILIEAHALSGDGIISACGGSGPATSYDSYVS